MFTHYIPALAPAGRTRQQQTSLCGEFIDPNLHDADPTCPACQLLIQEDAQQLAELQDETWDPRQRVNVLPFDPCAGYQERRARR